ncbi:MAG TPA: hypothetical protein VFQ42_22465 [Mycobacterium sp.]|nr:hypothetical protein [Mycobacterium sp.]
MSAPNRICCFLGTEREAGFWSQPHSSGKRECTHTADWCIEYANKRTPDHTTDACSDHLAQLLDPSTINSVTRIA